MTGTPSSVVVADDVLGRPAAGGGPDRVGERPDVALGDLADREAAGRRDIAVGEHARHVFTGDEVDRRRAAGDIDRAQSRAAARGHDGLAVDRVKDVVIDATLGHVPRHRRARRPAGTVEAARLAVAEREPGGVERQRAGETERRVRLRRVPGDLLADRDRPARRRWLDVDPVAEDMGDPGREVDELDVVAVEVVRRAAERPERVLRAWELVHQDRVPGHTALGPQAARLGRLLALLLRQLNRRRPRQVHAGNRVGVHVEQGGRSLRDDRGRVRARHA